MSDLYDLKREYLILKENKEDMRYPLLCIELLKHMKVLSHAEIYHLLNEVITYLPMHELTLEHKEQLEYYKTLSKQHRYYKEKDFD